MPKLTELEKLYWRKIDLKFNKRTRCSTPHPNFFKKFNIDISKPNNKAAMSGRLNGRSQSAEPVNEFEKILQKKIRVKIENSRFSNYSR